MKKTVTALLAIVMIFALAACGKSGPDISGKYTCTEISFDGQAYEAYSVEEYGECYVDLATGGKGTYFYGDMEFEMTWKLNGEAFTGEVDYFDSSTEMNGTYKDGTLELQFIDTWKHFTTEK